MIESWISSGRWLLDSLLIVVAFAAVVSDVRTRRIPNVLTFSTMGLGAMVSVVVEGPSGLVQAVAGLAVAVALFVLPVALRILGAGDLKLLAAVGAIGGPVLVLGSALYAVIAGGAIAELVLAHKRQLVPVPAGFGVDALTRRWPIATTGIRLPYAVPIAIGTLAAMVLR